MQRFIRVERTSDWKLHIWCIREMAPHFNAAGHLHYAKSVGLYLQQVESLEKTMRWTSKNCLQRRDTSPSNQYLGSFWTEHWKVDAGTVNIWKDGITDSALAKRVHALLRCALHVIHWSDPQEFILVHLQHMKQIVWYLCQGLVG